MPDPTRERDLAAAADAGIHLIALPTPFAVGRVNCWLIEDDPLTLVDCGPNSGTALTTLENGLRARGHRVEDLQRIVLTHQHIDHVGLAQILADRSGAEVCCLDALAPWLATFAEQTVVDDIFSSALMHAHGIPEDMVLVLRSVSASYRAWGASVAGGVPLTPGGTLSFADRSLRILHRPGHSPSDTVFHDEARGILIGGDHLIAHISSNPLMARPLDSTGATPPQERPQALVTYLASLAQTARMDLALLLTGHGDPITDHVSLIAARERGHERRKRKIAGLIDQGPRTAFELATAMWGNIAVTQAYLTLSEVLGHVDLLLNDGTVTEHWSDDGVVRFSAT
ncbi:MAG: fold metallo-hydrolase [Solirubrobacterales bacterium]|nr:fold metallo-hydrolase [Solirubrobacterales bacterium]